MINKVSVTGNIAKIILNGQVSLLIARYSEEEIFLQECQKYKETQSFQEYLEEQELLYFFEHFDEIYEKQYQEHHR